MPLVRLVATSVTFPQPHNYEQNFGSWNLGTRLLQFRSSSVFALKLKPPGLRRRAYLAVDVPGSYKLNDYATAPVGPCVGLSGRLCDGPWDYHKPGHTVAQTARVCWTSSPFVLFLRKLHRPQIIQA